MRKKWGYACMDCGRKMQSESRCPRCVRDGMPGDRVGRICCNTCGRAGDVNIEGTYITCRKDGQTHELGDRCKQWDNREVPTRAGATL